MVWHKEKPIKGLLESLQQITPTPNPLEINWFMRYIIEEKNSENHFYLAPKEEIKYHREPYEI